MIYNAAYETTGNTPLIRLSSFSDNAEIIGKFEGSNPAGSVKDRIAVNMILTAISDGHITEGTVILEPTSGNTGIGLATVCAKLGHKLILTMPESMSLERRSLLAAYGAELVLTPASGGMKAAINKVEELKVQYPNHFVPSQFDNPANPAIHETTTAVEILRDTDQNLHMFVAGVGTGGTITGTSKGLKKVLPNVQIVAVEPDTSAVISGESPGKHGIQGIGAGFIPKNLDVTVIDEVVKVSMDEAVAAMKQLAQKEGMLCGISSGAAVAAAVNLANRPENSGKRIVVMLPDTGERYISGKLF